ncbi:MAG: (d)CMP kinase [Clostridiales bacterium]|jgi:cytidylate kinase|nr:(d)CMP kinase [Clostridiales bacterium]
MGYSIAIDGPCGSGKSTVARLIAGRLGFMFVDTGAMYRVVALHCVNVGADGEEAVETALENMRLSITYKNGEQRVSLGGEDVTDAIRAPEISKASSKVAALRKVRDKMVEQQRLIAANENVVMDGRDIGDRVLPDATLKIYLDAELKRRAERRFNELASKGIDVSLNNVYKEIEERDYRDLNRTESPLRVAKDAVVINTERMSPEEVTDVIEAMFKKRI